MRFIKLISILFSIGFSLFAQDGRLSIVDANSPIKIPRRDVEWLEFKIVNGSDFTLDTLRVEVGYEQGVRPLESVRWKGRASFSHAKGMIKNRGKRLLIFDLSNIGPRETIDMWAGFVGEKNGEYDFSINLYLLDESGNWQDANTILEHIAAQKTEIEDTENKPLPSTLQPKEQAKEPVPETQETSESKPIVPKWTRYTFFIAVFIVFFILIYLAIFLFKGAASQKKKQKRGARSYYRGRTTFEFIPDLEHLPDEETIGQEEIQQKIEIDENRVSSEAEKTVETVQEEEKEEIPQQVEKIEELSEKPAEKDFQEEPLIGSEQTIESSNLQSIPTEFPSSEIIEMDKLERIVELIEENKKLKEELRKLLKNE